MKIINGLLILIISIIICLPRAHAGESCLDLLNEDAPKSPETIYEEKMRGLDDLLSTICDKQLERMKNDDKGPGENCVSLWHGEMEIYLQQLTLMYKHADYLDACQKKEWSKAREQKLIKLRSRIDKHFQFILLNIDLGAPPCRAVA